MNGIIVLNKAQDFTSMDCCAIMRSILHEKKIGHTGTLDPNATGVLPIFFGKATRLISYFEPLGKKYTAKFRLGYTSDTEDVWGNLTKQAEFVVSEDDIKKYLPIGDIDQIPPMYSAKKVNGQKLYDLARNGQVIERKPNRVHIYSCELTEFDGQEGTLEIECSSGTYVRTICADLGKSLGCGAIMTSLVRTATSGFFIENSAPMDLIMNIKAGTLKSSALDKYIISIDDAMGIFPRIDVDDDVAKLIMNGNPLFKKSIPDAESLGKVVTVYNSGKFIATLKDGVLDKVFNENI